MKQIPCLACAKSLEEVYLYTACNHFLCVQCAINMITNFEQDTNPHTLICCGVQTKVETDSYRTLKRRRQNLQNEGSTLKDMRLSKNENHSQTLLKERGDRQNLKSRSKSRSISGSKAIHRQKVDSDIRLRGAISRKNSRKRSPHKTFDSFQKNSIHKQTHSTSPFIEINQPLVNTLSDTNKYREQFDQTLINQLSFEKEKLKVNNGMVRRCGQGSLYQDDEIYRAHASSYKMDQTDYQRAQRVETKQRGQRPREESITRSNFSENSKYTSKCKDSMIREKDNILIQEERYSNSAVESNQILPNLGSNPYQGVDQHHPIVSFSRKENSGFNKTENNSLFLNHAQRDIMEEGSKDNRNVGLAQLSLQSLLTVHIQRIRSEFNYLHKKLRLKEDEMVAGLFNLYEAQTRMLLLQNYTYSSQNATLSTSTNGSDNKSATNICHPQRFSQITPIQMERVYLAMQKYIQSFKIPQLYSSISIAPCYKEKEGKLTFNSLNSQSDDHFKGSGTPPKVGVFKNNNHNNSIRYSRSTGNVLQRLDGNQSRMKDMFNRHYLGMS